MNECATLILVTIIEIWLVYLVIMHQLKKIDDKIDGGDSDE